VANIGGFVAGDTYNWIACQNPVHDHAFVRLRLRGVRANRGGIGAKLLLEVEERDGTRRRIHHVVGTGGSFGASPLLQNIGVGDARRVVSLAIRWPGSGTRQVLHDVPMGQVLEVREGDDQLTTRALRPVTPGGKR